MRSARNTKSCLRRPYTKQELVVCVLFLMIVALCTQMTSAQALRGRRRSANETRRRQKPRTSRESTSSRVEEPNIGPSGVLRRNVPEYYAIRRDQFLKEFGTHRHPLSYGPRSMFYQEIPYVKELRRIDVYFIVSTPTDRDVALAPARSNVGGIFVQSDPISDRIFLHARGTADAREFRSLRAARTYLARMKGRVQPPKLEVDPTAPPKPSPLRYLPSAEPDPNDPTPILTHEGHDVVLDYDAQPFEWSYNVHEMSVYLNDGVVDAIRSPDDVRSLQVAMRSTDIVSVPLQVTFLVMVENLQTTISEDTGPGRANGNAPTLKQTVRSRESNHGDEVYFSFSIGSLEEKAGPPAVPHQFLGEDPIIRESRASRGRAKSPPKPHFTPWLKAHCKHVLSNQWCRVSLLASQDKQRAWIDGNAIRTWVWKPQKVWVSGRLIDIQELGTLPDRAYWCMSVSSKAQRLLITDLRVSLPSDSSKRSRD